MPPPPPPTKIATKEESKEPSKSPTASTCGGSVKDLGRYDAQIFGEGDGGRNNSSKSKRH